MERQSPLFWLIIASTLLESDVSSTTTMSNVGNHWRENEQPCQVSCLRNRNNMWKDNANTKLPGRNPKAIIRVKRDLMRLNLYDLPRALVWLFMRLNGGEGGAFEGNDTQTSAGFLHKGRSLTELKNINDFILHLCKTDLIWISAMQFGKRGKIYTSINKEFFPFLL